MSLVINHNMMAMGAARNLGIVYDRLAKSTQRLSSGLRINSAGDDAAGLAIRELMRADILVMNQGLRNAADGISMIQTAEGAMAVIDEKLTRMKELAEQAATGTYTTVQRMIMNSEYQAMAAEIDRIANATEFNGTKLLDGSITDFHEGSGLKIHFGTGNNAAEDYYFVNIGDTRATAATGLQIAGDAKNDVHRQLPSCCGSGGFDSLNQVIESSSGASFVYGYNLFADSEVSSLDTPSYIGGIYTQASGTSLQDLIDEINTGTQSRIQVNLGPTGSSGLVSNLGLTSGQTMNVCFSGTDSNGQTINEVIQFYHTTSAAAPADATGITYVEVSANAALEAAEVLANAMSASTNFQTMYDNSANTVMVFYNEAGDYNDFTACDIGSATGTANVTWTTPNTTQSWTTDNDRANFGLGGENWVKAIAVKDGDKYFMNLTGRDVGENHDVEIFGVSGYTVLNGFGTTDFEEIVDAADGRWDGAHIRTQSHAQESLAALDAAILRKDVIRANLGAYQNRLENTMTNLEIQAEALQASESRISDVDVAVEMTEFTRNNVLAQAAVSMLAQANSLGQLALSLLQ